MSTSQLVEEVAGGIDRGGNGKWVVQGKQKTHTSLESVGFMFKVNRFGTLYFDVVHEVLRPCNLLISLAFIGGASRIRTADLWIMIPSL